MYIGYPTSGLRSSGSNRCGIQAYLDFDRKVRLHILFDKLPTADNILTLFEKSSSDCKSLIQRIFNGR